MIISKAFDVEVFHNLFSVTFVDIKSYFKTFADCVDDKGNPIPLTEKLSVKEIKNRLNSVKSDVFYISDTNDSKLLDLVAYIDAMRPHYSVSEGADGQTINEPIRYDLFGFNNVGYDDIMIQAFMMYFNMKGKTKYLIEFLKEISDKIISLQSDRSLFYEDKELELIRQYKLPYASVDVQKIFGLNSASVSIDKDTGERNKFGKSLKQTSINLKWYELLEFKLPPITDEENNAYYKKDIVKYHNYSTAQLNKLITNDFDRYIMPQYVDDMLHYNLNDVYIVCEMARLKPDEIKLRYAITNAFKINVLSSARANIADKLTVKFYSDMSGLHKEKFIKERTERTRLSFNKIIFPHIQFKTKQLQDLLEEMKKVSIYHTNKDAFSKEIEFYGTTYTLATGGIHSVDPPRICKSDEKYLYLHHDYTSYYPSIMISYNIAPKHLHQKTFTKMMSFLKDTRVKCKHGGDVNVIENVPNKIAAEALKIVINSIYGKLGSELFFLYDRFAQMQVTINGQLMTMTLIEELELNGIHVISANTDGIVIKLPRDKFNVYKDITDRWNETNKMGADYEEYEEIISRDVNNYFDVQVDGSVEFKGALDPKQYLKELKKGYDMPIVALAVYKFFRYNKPVMETLQEHKDILDFCKTQNVGKQFEVIYDVVENGEVKTIHSQRYVRFYVATDGVVIRKQNVNDITVESRLAGGLPVQILNTLDDKPIENRHINYKYYYDECYKLINPIMLGISPNQKGNKLKGTVSGKVLLKQYAEQYLTLFD